MKYLRNTWNGTVAKIKLFIEKHLSAEMKYKRLYFPQSK